VKIFGWLADHAGCGWYRIVLPLGALRGADCQTRWNRRMSPEDWDSDVIVGQRVSLPGPSGRWQRIAASTGQRPLLVYELDDNLWEVDAGKPAEIRSYFNDPEVQANIKRNIQVSDLVTVSTEPLAEVVRRLNPNVVVLPNCVPQEFIHWRPGCHNDRFTLGWQGSPTHDRDWRGAREPVERWFNRVKRAGRRVEMHTIGTVPETFPRVHPHRHTAWSESIPDYYRSIDWHVALAPLAATRFNESKSYLRVLEAGMLGYPSVASEVTAYRGAVTHGVTGFLVSQPSHWGEALQALSDDPTLAEKMGAAAREWARQYTIEANAYLWLEAYKQ
jgi:glycosyltransferase involved in cell wall biosynthesis